MSQQNLWIIFLFCGGPGANALSELLSLCFEDRSDIYRFPIRLNFSETPFTYGIKTEARDFSSVFG
jgi:hypothetical protein